MDEYLQKLADLIETKDMERFWILCDRSDFKPIRKSKSDIKTMLKEKKNHYKGKKIAYISLYCNLKAIKDQSLKAFVITIHIYEINDNGEIDKTGFDTWGLVINYKLEDLGKRKFKIKDLETLMRLCAEKNVRSEILNGISFTNLMKKLDKLNIDLDDY